MVLDKAKFEELEKAARPLMEYLSAFHPHTKIMVTCDCAELVEGIANFVTSDYVKD
jgi:hypothetical protein